MIHSKVGHYLTLTFLTLSSNYNKLSRLKAYLKKNTIVEILQYPLHDLHQNPIRVSTRYTELSKNFQLNLLFLWEAP